jgi:hypothetical protein
LEDRSAKLSKSYSPDTIQYLGGYIYRFSNLDLLRLRKLVAVRLDMGRGEKQQYATRECRCISLDLRLGRGVQRVSRNSFWTVLSRLPKENRTNRYYLYWSDIFCSGGPEWLRRVSRSAAISVEESDGASEDGHQDPIPDCSRASRGVSRTEHCDFGEKLLIGKWR